MISYKNLVLASEPILTKGPSTQSFESYENFQKDFEKDFQMTSPSTQSYKENEHINDMFWNVIEYSIHDANKDIQEYSFNKGFLNEMKASDLLNIFKKNSIITDMPQDDEDDENMTTDDDYLIAT
jgi:hypothetical protein